MGGTLLMANSGTLLLAIDTNDLKESLIFLALRKQRL